MRAVFIGASYPVDTSPVPLARPSGGWYASQMPSDLTRLRPAEERDARSLSELWADAFPGEPRAEVRLQALLEGTGPYGGLETCWVAEQGRAIVGGLRFYPLRMHLWGHAFRVQGIASVAVVPAARRQGIGLWMCERAIQIGLQGGAALSALYPFRAAFYERMGYALVGELHRYQFRAADLPELPGSDRVHRLGRKEAARLLPGLYESLLPETHGLVERTPEMWRSVFEQDDPIYGVSPEGGELRGYFIARGERGRIPDRATLWVRELLAADERAYQALVGWLSVQRDQWRQIRYDALPGEQFHLLLPHPRLPGRPSARGLWFPSATLLRGPMLRILDLQQVLEIVRLAEGDTLSVSDAQLPENSGRWVGTAEGPKRCDDEGEEEERGVRSIGQVTELFVAGRLPGQAERFRDWRPAQGLTDFRLLDVF
ncbi:MAG: GNAT family N-acetyltransferase [Gemmatimonadetes bacterium]|nr:GNAT family N-acetyltransferase [Gemmatimonadota bacterium]